MGGNDASGEVKFSQMTKYINSDVRDEWVGLIGKGRRKRGFQKVGTVCREAQRVI